jgi:tRNA(Ile)-lysidine synthase
MYELAGHILRLKMSFSNGDFLKDGIRMIIKKVEHFIERHQLLHENATVIVGVSGGPDSLALLSYFLKIREKWDLTLVAAHIDHMFRGLESEQDSLFVENYCKTKGIHFEGKQVNVRKHQKNNNQTAQEAARECRYAFFEQVMVKWDGDYLALGHHGDDQIETIVMRLIRGSATGGLSGIPVKREFCGGVLIRPFLTLSKAEIEAYCEKEALHPRRDSSNDKDNYSRNRVRHHVLPFIKKENPNAHERFQYVSELLSADEAFLTELAKEKLNEIIKRKQRKKVSISITSLLAQPIPLQKRLIHLILKYLYGDGAGKVSSVHIESIFTLIKGSHPSGKCSLPEGLEAIKSYDDLTLTFIGERFIPYYYVLDAPGRVNAVEGFTISAECTDVVPGKENDSHFVCEQASVKLPIIIRTREAGDRMQIDGLAGSKKIKDIFINGKIPLCERDRWPVIVDSAGQILWLPQLRKSPLVIKGKGNGPYLLLKYTKNRQVGY